MTVLPFRHRASPAPPIIVEPDTVAVTVGGIHSALNLTSATVVKATPGRLGRLIIIGRGHSGAFVLNDCATIDTATAGNTVLVIPHGLVAGSVVAVDWPCAVGIVLSAVPNGNPIIAVSYS